MNSDDSGNNRASKRGREGKLAVDDSEPPVKKTASTKATETTRIEHVETSDSYLSNTRYVCFFLLYELSCFRALVILFVVLCFTDLISSHCLPYL